MKESRVMTEKEERLLFLLRAVMTAFNVYLEIVSISSDCEYYQFVSEKNHEKVELSIDQLLY